MTSLSPKQDSMPSDGGFGSVSSPTIQSMIRSSQQIKQEMPAHSHVSLNSSIRQKHLAYSSSGSSSSGYIKKHHKSGKGSTSAVSAKVNDYRKVSRAHCSRHLFEPRLTAALVVGTQNTKPLMEKRRRERINRSLEELKNLILDQTNHNVS